MYEVRIYNSLECLCHFFKRFYLFIFRERAREEEGEGGKHQCEKEHQLPASRTPPARGLACAPTGNGTGDLSVHRPALNPLSHTSQGYLCHF